MVNKNERSKVRFYWYFGLLPETIFKVSKPVYALFTMLVKKTLSVVNIKALKHCKNLLKVSNGKIQYAISNNMSKFPQGKLQKNNKNQK